MCGIIGFIGNKNASEIIYNGLKHLEYRGYDSVGVAYIKSKDVVIKKDVGKLNEVNSKLNFLDVKSNIGLGHCRWATTGAVTKENAHPHTDCNNIIVVVHNGIIENYLELKNDLIKKGHNFRSDTDTEVFSHLIEQKMKEGKSFEEACSIASRIIQGTAALVIANTEEEKLIGIKIGSPLVLGVSDFGYFLASDIPAFLNYTKKVIFLKDFEMVVLDKSGYRIYTIDESAKMHETEKKVYTIDWDAEQAEKGSFDHFMIKEILEQVDAISNASIQDVKKLEKFSEKILKSDKIFFVASGTSYHASLVGSYLMNKICGISTIPIIASEFSHYINSINDKTLIIAISQSGETYDVLEAVRLAKNKGAKIFSIVNVNGSTLTWESDDYLLMNCGPEIGVAATKTYSAEIVLLELIACFVAKKFEEGKMKINYLRNIIYNLTSESSRNAIKDIAKFLRDKSNLFLIGRGLLYPTAMEGALKIKEISYIHAEAFAGGELKHGTLSLIEDGVPVIALIDEATKDSTLSNAREVKARKGIVIGVSPFHDEAFDFWIKVPECNNLNPIAFIIPLQLLAYYLAVLRGFDPDKPRNLSKSITVK